MLFEDAIAMASWVVMHLSGVITPDKCSARFMLHCDPEFG